MGRLAPLTDEPSHSAHFRCFRIGRCDTVVLLAARRPFLTSAPTRYKTGHDAIGGGLLAAAGRSLYDVSDHHPSHRSPRHGSHAALRIEDLNGGLHIDSRAIGLRQQNLVGDAARSCE